MAKYELSEAADRDLNDIYIYSYREFGEAKADAYLTSLEECFERLAEFPDIGRPIDTSGLATCGFPMPATRSIS
jgi:toxin ParE1/3/4